MLTAEIQDTDRDGDDICLECGAILTGEEEEICSDCADDISNQQK